MLRERFRVGPSAELVQQLGRPLDVGEQKGDDPGRKVIHHRRRVYGSLRVWSRSSRAQRAPTRLPLRSNRPSASAAAVRASEVARGVQDFRQVEPRDGDLIEEAHTDGDLDGALRERPSPSRSP